MTGSEGAIDRPSPQFKFPSIGKFITRSLGNRRAQAVAKPAEIALKKK